MSSPCGWTVFTDLCDASNVDPAIREWAESIAVDVLYTATGRQFSACDMYLRPGTALCVDAFRPLDFWATTSRGIFYNDWRYVSLPTPVIDVTSVVIDGVTLDPYLYTVIRHNRLARTDGQLWPSSNNLVLDDTHPGTWSVTVKYGVEPPQEAQLMAGILACEFIKSRVNKAKCRLPGNVTGISSAGITTSIADPLTYLKDGFTGIHEIDLWIKSVNPGDVRQPPVISSGWSSRTRQRI